MSTHFLHEPARDIPISADVDICVLGGSCTGVFAAVRAARLGLTVALIEKTNAFGGMATQASVNIWHSILDTHYDKQIIGGLSVETVRRLEKRRAVEYSEQNASRWATFNPAEMKIELDELIREHPTIRPFLHTLYCRPVCGGDGNVEAVLIENKSGRSAIKASVFIDATGDGDLAAHVGWPFTFSEHLQPPTTCARIDHWMQPELDAQALYSAHREEFDAPVDSGWRGNVPGLEMTGLSADTHVFNTNAADADQLTAAEMEGRRLVRVRMDIVRQYAATVKPVALSALAAHLGVRETRRFQCEHRLTEMELLHGVHFDDAIANGAYRVDVHHAGGGGFLFKYLDGTTQDCRPGGMIPGRWREEQDVDPTYYQIPYRTMVRREFGNLILAGRMICTDTNAFGAVRVMINLNQTGEAAGVAAALAIREDRNVWDVSPVSLRTALADGGSIML